MHACIKLLAYIAWLTDIIKDASAVILFTSLRVYIVIYDC